MHSSLKRTTFLLSLLLIWSVLPAFAQLELAGLFVDRMVIQRDQPVSVWGSAAPGSAVTVSMGGKTASVTTDGSGQWKADLPRFAAGGPLEMQVSAGTESKTVKDIMIGDVWLMAGQSNMVLALQASTEWPEVKTAGDFPGIRICKLPSDFSFAPEERYSRALRWDPLVSAKASYFSAVAYHFARAVQPVAGVTVGLVQASSGGTQAEQWTPEDALKAALPDNPLFAARDKAKAKQVADPAVKLGVMESGAACLYNGTIHPMRHARFAGVVWYQGEANTRSKRDYKPVLTTMVKAWRTAFQQPELPFIIVQLPNFGLPKDDGWMRVREAQRLTAQELGLALVVTIDQGSPETIHPPNKAEVGRRCGLAALQHVYAQAVEGTSPRPRLVRADADAVTVEFDGFTGDLVLKGGAAPQGFELAAADGIFHAATAEVKGRIVTVKSGEVPHPATIRYLWANSPEAVTLYSAAGLPAVPFVARTDGTR